MNDPVDELIKRIESLVYEKDMVKRNLMASEIFRYMRTLAIYSHEEIKEIIHDKFNSQYQG